MDNFFAGFIITYNRPEILLDTIQKLFDQTFPPEKLWIIDNSEDFTTRQKIEALNNSKLIYHRVGYNAGPAGAAAIGLRLVEEAGYEWIIWGDDDDPPPFDDTFQKLFYSISNNKEYQIGQIGVVGQYFDSKFGKTIRISDQKLFEKEVLKVDTISGNQSKIISSKVVRNSVFPDERLFFGFEELDFDIKLKNAGFDSLVYCPHFLKVRDRYKRLGFERPLFVKKSNSHHWREYYSTRNLLTILKRNGLYFGYLYYLIKSIAKGFYGFRYGWDFGIKNFTFIYKGILHSMLGKMGRQI